MENREVQLIRPPVFVRPGPGSLGSGGVDCGVLALADARSRILVMGPIDVLISHVSPSPSYAFRAEGSSLWNVGALDPRPFRRLAVARCVCCELAGGESRRRDRRHVPGIGYSAGV